jgi:hypothetical protein
MKMATIDDRETTVDRSTYWQNFHYLQPAQSALSVHLVTITSHNAIIF